MEKEISLKEKVVNIMRKRQGYTSDLGGFHFLAEDFFEDTVFEIIEEIKAALKDETLPKTLQEKNEALINYYKSKANEIKSRV